MDRFIAEPVFLPRARDDDLKSNMDRFIDIFTNITESGYNDLKSNMDRFIVKFLLTLLSNINI